MRILLDTHFLIWSINEPTTMTRTEHSALADAASLHVSAISLWELRIKWRALDRNGKRKGVLDPAVALAFINASDFGLVPLAASDSLVPLDPPIGHRDPFDEMLLVHAQQLGARLLTRDRLLIGHPLTLSL